MSRNVSHKHIASLNPSIFDQLIRTKRKPSLSKSYNLNQSSVNLNVFQKGKIDYSNPQQAKGYKKSGINSNKSLRDNIRFTFGELASSKKRNSQEIQKPNIPEEQEPKLTAKRQDKDLNLHVIFKAKPRAQERDSIDHESDSLSTPTCKDCFITSESTAEKNEATMEYQGTAAQNEKYGNYESLLRLYENEKRSRENFEHLYERVYEENKILRETAQNLRKSNENNQECNTKELHKENRDLKSIIEAFKLKNKQKEGNEDTIENFKKENKEMRETLEHLRLSKEQQNLLLTKLQNENNEYKQSVERLTKSKNESVVLIHKYQIDIQELNQKIKKLKESLSNSKPDEKPKPQNLIQGNLFLKNSVEAFKNKDSADQGQIIDKAELLFSENENLKKVIQNLKVQLESDKHAQQVEILQKELEKTKFENESQKSQMKHEIEGLKKVNKEMFNNFRQKLREFDHYECHTLMKRTATKIPLNALVLMEKEELISQFNLLKKEYEELSKKMLSQADEMFEKKNE